jgi:hypothetical protein
MKMISNIVFTKNRPLQLEGYIESLYRFFPVDALKTYVLYKEELFEDEYKLLFRKYPDITIIKESNFHSDFLQCLSQISTKYILFGVDDVAYFEEVDFDTVDETFNTFAGDILGFSLRFSKESIEGGNDPVREAVVAGQTVYSINWKQGRTPNTRYPFELCSTIYPTSFVKEVVGSTYNDNPLVKKLFLPDSAFISMLRKVKSPRSILKSFGYFYSPNTLESWVCRWCREHSEGLPDYLYFQKLCASAIQVNMVNTSTKTKTKDASEHTVEVLAEKYRQGYRLDIAAIEKNKPVQTHVGNEHFELTKKE